MFYVKTIINYYTIHLAPLCTNRRRDPSIAAQKHSFLVRYFKSLHKYTNMLRLASLSLRFSRTRLAPSVNCPRLSPYFGLNGNQYRRGLAQAVFERTKPHLNVGTIGHVDHGKVRNAESPSIVFRSSYRKLHFQPLTSTGSTSIYLLLAA